EKHTLAYSRVIEESSGTHLVRIAKSGFEQEIVETIDALPHRFRDLPYRISTGPVVTFRSRDLLCGDQTKNTAPLVWMHNVRPFATRFPKKNGKPAHILVSEKSQKLLVPSERYVLLKRFTAKEERRRLVAGIFESSDSYS